MRDHVRGDWAGFHPKTNVFWLHYLVTYTSNNNNKIFFKKPIFPDRQAPERRHVQEGLQEERRPPEGGQGAQGDAGEDTRIRVYIFLLFFYFLFVNAFFKINFVISSAVDLVLAEGNRVEEEE